MRRVPREARVGGREGDPDWEGCLGGAVWEAWIGRCVWVVVGLNSVYIVACNFGLIYLVLSRCSFRNKIKFKFASRLLLDLVWSMYSYCAVRLIL